MRGRALRNPATLPPHPTLRATFSPAGRRNEWRGSRVILFPCRQYSGSTRLQFRPGRANQRPFTNESLPADVERAGASRFFSPPGRSPRQRDEGVTVEIFGELTPSSDPSGHLLPGGEKKQAARFAFHLVSFIVSILALPPQFRSRRINQRTLINQPRLTILGQ